MIDFTQPPQSAILPVDCHIGALGTTQVGNPVTHVIDNYPPLPTKLDVIDNWPPLPPKK